VEGFVAKNAGALNVHCLLVGVLAALSAVVWGVLAGSPTHKGDCMRI